MVGHDSSSAKLFPADHSWACVVSKACSTMESKKPSSDMLFGRPFYPIDDDMLTDSGADPFECRNPQQAPVPPYSYGYYPYYPPYGAPYPYYSPPRQQDVSATVSSGSKPNRRMRKSSEPPRLVEASPSLKPEQDSTTTTTTTTTSPSDYVDL